jgi:hypothetical protein
MRKKNEPKERRKNIYIYSQTSRLENTDKLQLHHNHENFLFLTVMLLFAYFKVNYWWIYAELEKKWKKEGHQLPPLCARFHSFQFAP